MQQELIQLAVKSNLVLLKFEVDKIDIDKLKPIPADLIKLSNVVNNNVLKKLCVINQLQK